jgi:periplasmic protein CpxP/Spy
MKSVFKPLLIATVLAAVGFAAVAQGSEHGGMRHGKGDPAKMQQMRAKYQDELKAKLKLAPNQESAWASFTAAMQPSAAMLAARPDRAAMDKLTTPERIDKMKSLRAARDVQMNQRADATKAFYAALTPEQKQVFDAEHKGRGARHGGGHGGGHHGMQPKG